jgi:CDP-diacylglycerol--serine O-phosphatidyltransferase
MIKHIPNTLTLLNLIAGFAATIYAINGYNEYAAFCIMTGMLLDFSDGFAARLLKAYSAIGKDLDSLADMVTFGIAPGAIVLNLLTDSGLGMAAAFAIAALIPAASALRLARFNNDTTQATSFRGLATPASAFTVISVVLASSYSDIALADTLSRSAWFISLLSLFLAVMMLINVRMFSLKLSHMRWSGNEERYIFAATSLLLIIILRMAAAPLIMAAYIVISLVSGMIRRRKHEQTPEA